MLLHYVGDDVCDIFDTMTVPAPEPDTNGDVYKSVIKAISDHFEPHKCVDHHVYNFRKEAQRPNEKTSEFYTRGQDYKRFSSMSRCSTHNLCSEMT